MSKIHTLALSLLLVLLAFSIIPLASANFIPVTERALNLALMLLMAFSVTFFVVLFAWLTARRGKQRHTVH